MFPCVLWVFRYNKIVIEVAPVAHPGHLRICERKNPQEYHYYIKIYVVGLGNIIHQSKIHKVLYYVLLKKFGGYNAERGKHVLKLNKHVKKTTIYFETIKC
jgi:hypothetical protein